MLATTATAALAPKFGAPTKIASARSTFASGAKPVAALRVTSAGASARLSRKDRAARLVVSANLFNRLGRVIGSYANSLVSAAEDPEKILDQTVIEMQEDLVKMRQASAQVIASQKQLENKYKQAQATADDWYRRAELAMSKGDEELAREALSRKKSYQENADSMKANLAEQEKAVEKLISNTRFLESKMAEAKSKKDTLKARAASAKTNKAVQDLVSGVSTSSALLVTLLKHYAARCLAPDALARADEFDPGDKEHGSFLWTTLGALTNLLNGPEFDFDDGGVR